jgi:hypothetical protein
MLFPVFIVIGPVMQNQFTAHTGILSINKYLATLYFGPTPIADHQGIGISQKTTLFGSNYGR